MKKLSILAIVLILNIAAVLAQSSVFEPFRVNNFKTNSASAELNKVVDDAKIVDVNFDVVNRILDAKSNSISIKIPYNGTDLQVTMQKFDILRDDAKIVAGTESGDKPLANKTDFVAYTGNLNDKNSPLVVVTFFRNDVTAMIMTGQDTYVLARQKNSGDFVSYQSSKMKIHNDFKCGTDEFAIPEKITEVQRSLSGNLNPMSTATLIRANIAVESDYDFFTFQGSSVERATNYIIALYVPVSALYVRDINVHLQIGYLRVWSTSADPYPDATSSNTILQSFRSYWNANMQSTPRTIAHFITNRPGGLGGIAYVDVLCANVASGFGYAFSDIDGVFNQLPVYSWDVMVVAHETGHNFGSPHTHNCNWPGGPIDSCYTVEGGCYSGPQIPRVGTIMSYCHLNATIALLFGPLPTQLIRSRAEVAPCLNPLTGYLVATPNGGQIFRSANNSIVIWGTSNTGTVDIEYTSNNGSSWNPVQSGVDATLRTVTWSVPYIPTTTQAKIRVFQSGNPGSGDESDSVFQIRPTIVPFSLIDPPQLYRTYVSSGDTSRLHFTFNKAGTLPEFKYKWTIGTTNNVYSYTTLTNNNGSDSVLSISRGRLDSLITTWGAANVGDSLRVRWSVKCYTQLDSLTSSTNYLITFLRTVIGIEPISSNIPDKYFISPNYPNPFNPVTKIKFGLPASSNVKITIFDMLGKEVQILANSDMEAGEYLAEWNAVNFASGIYIYKIEAVDKKGNSFIETKRMVLVK
ncbi:MAG: M12 family metallo-peptidase [Ignavibacteria bacterium]